MNNCNWPMIVLGLATIAFAALYVREKRTGHRCALAEIQEDYRQLQVDHGIHLARADDLEQDVERRYKERDMLNAHLRILVETLNIRSAELECLKREREYDEESMATKPRSTYKT